MIQLQLRYGTFVQDLTRPEEVPPDVTPPSQPAPVSRWRWAIHLALIAAYPLLVAGASLGQTAHGPALSGKPGRLLLVCAMELLVFGTIFGVAWVASRASRNDLLFRWRSGFLPVISGIGYSIGLRIALFVFIAAISTFLILFQLVTPESLKEFFSSNRQDVDMIVDVGAMRNNPLYFWLTVTFVSFVLAGLREELWRSAFLAGTRGVWPKYFSSRSGQIAAAAIAAVFFGFGHLPLGGFSVAITGLLGFGLGLIMIFHGSIWPAVIAHGMFDATSLALFALVAGDKAT